MKVKYFNVKKKIVKFLYFFLLEFFLDCIE